MKLQFEKFLSKRRLQRFLQWFVVASILIPSAVVAPKPLPQLAVSWSSGPERKTEDENIDPQLLQMVAQSPDQMVRVIVQKMTQDQQIEQQVAALGGEVLIDLSIIDAFAAQMSAQAAYQLAQEPMVRWISLDAAVVSTQAEIDAAGANIKPNNYLATLGIPQVAQMGYNGDGIGVAVVDSGVTAEGNLIKLERKEKFASFSGDDDYGHGTHVAGIIAGSGNDSNGRYKGIAPGVALYSLKISDDTGKAFESTAIAALQWIYTNKTKYNIRVVNLSINSTGSASYNQSPLNAAAEILWFNGIVVVASSGNTGRNDATIVSASPANDPFIITVGATNDKNTDTPTDDVVTAYTSLGTTIDGHSKPDVMAPGQAIYSTLSAKSQWRNLYPERCAIKCKYFRLSGTSMAAPMVSGIVALMLQKEPSLTPDQVKYRLVHSTTRSLSLNRDGEQFTFPYVDGYAAVTATTTGSANTGLKPSQLLWTGSMPINWTSVNWGSVNWGSVNWNSVNWGSVNWNSVNWNSSVLERTDGEGGALPNAEGEEMWDAPVWPEEIAQPSFQLFMPAVSSSGE